MYKVIEYFADLTDGCRPYAAGDIYPAEGAPAPTQERIAALLGANNKQVKPLIVEVDPEEEKAAKEAEKKVAKEAAAAKKKADEEANAKEEAEKKVAEQPQE